MMESLEYLNVGMGYRVNVTLMLRSAPGEPRSTVAWAEEGWSSGALRMPSLPDLPAHPFAR
jgi:hypothetical protein